MGLSSEPTPERRCSKTRCGGLGFRRALRAQPRECLPPRASDNGSSEAPRHLAAISQRNLLMSL